MSAPVSSLATLRQGLWKQNPILVSVLGLCPALAVTNSVENALVMGAATFFVLVGASALVSLLRSVIPGGVRISMFILIIATFVTIVDLSLQALLPAAHEQLGAFVALIVTNCLIMGRQEAFASRNRVPLAVADAVGMGLGFTLVMVCIGAVRELLGAGALLGVPVLGAGFEPWAIMLLPPGGFFSLAALLIVGAWLSRRRAARARVDGDGRVTVARSLETEVRDG